MATPDPFAGSGVALDYATMTHCLHGGGKTGSIKCLWAHVFYNVTWQVSALVDRNEITASMLAWVTDHLVVTLGTGYTLRPVVVATGASRTAYRPVVEWVSSSVFHLYFLSSTDAIVTTPGTNMTCTLFLIGV